MKLVALVTDTKYTVLAVGTPEQMGAEMARQNGKGVRASMMDISLAKQIASDPWGVL